MNQKIIFFHLLNNFTGSPLILRNVIFTARDLGKDVHLYTSNGSGFLSDIPGINYHSNFYIRSKYRGITLFTFFFSQFLLAFKLIKHKNDTSTFYVNTILPFSAIFIGKLLNKRVIVHVHEYEISPKLLNRFLFRIVRKYADEIIVVSKFLSENNSLRKANPRVIYNCVKEGFEEVASETLEPRDEFRVLMLASLRPYKGINEFVKLAKVMPHLSFDLVLSDTESDVNQWKTSIEIPRNLFVFPVQGDVIRFYRNASLILNLAHKDKCLETFGMTILEGMLFGIPAIVPTQGGVTELVVDGENGFLIDYTDLPQIKKRIEEMEEDPSHWMYISQNAYKRAKLFSRQRFQQEIELVLK